MAETVKHTPGPWFLINDHCVGGPESIDGLGQGIAMCAMRARSNDEAKANAALISAAPDLLGAVQEACSIIDMLTELLAKAEVPCSSMHDIILARAHDKICSAIAKAEGRS